MNQHPVSVLPAGAAERDAWIVSRRPGRNALDPMVPYAFHTEQERDGSGEIVTVATVMLTNRECPWRCTMCDLWRNTLAESVPVGAIPAQIGHALARLAPARHIKLYNSGSFFDPKAIPVKDYPAIAARLSGFGRVIVECHPSLVGDACQRFRELLPGRLEVAMGLETAHPAVLERLNKRMTLEQFEHASRRLCDNQIDVRAFVLVKPPFMRDDEALHWAGVSLELAFDCGATVATLIPTRGGNGAMEELAREGEFSPPTLAALEDALERGIAMKRGRVFADLWDAHGATACCGCRGPRIARLHAMNLRQFLLPRVECKSCGGRS